MPTATGRPTADEKREADRIRQRAARRLITAQITTSEWLAAEADAFEADLAALRAGKAAGTVPSYEHVERWYPAGDELTANRIKVDDGKARALGVADVLEARGLDVSTMMSFGLFAGRSTLRYAVRS
jgi:hypothetical protein